MAKVAVQLLVEMGMELIVRLWVAMVAVVGTVVGTVAVHKAVSLTAMVATVVVTPLLLVALLALLLKLPRSSLIQPQLSSLLLQPVKLEPTLLVSADADLQEAAADLHRHLARHGVHSSDKPLLGA